ALAIEAHVQSQVRSLELDRRPLPGALAQLIDDRVLGFQRAEMRVLDARRGSTELDRERAVRRQVLSPVDCGHACVQLFGRGSREITERHENAARSARPQTCAIRRLERALEQHTELELASG